MKLRVLIGFFFAFAFAATHCAVAADDNRLSDEQLKRVSQLLDDMEGTWDVSVTIGGATSKGTFHVEKRSGHWFIRETWDSPVIGKEDVTAVLGFEKNQFFRHVFGKTDWSGIHSRRWHLVPVGESEFEWKPASGKWPPRHPERVVDNFGKRTRRAFMDGQEVLVIGDWKRTKDPKSSHSKR